MMGHRERLVGGDEWDALTRSKRIHRWQPVARRWIKRKVQQAAAAGGIGVITIFEQIPEVFVEHYDAQFQAWGREFRARGELCAIVFGSDAW
jgi:hypothetical protein